MSSWKDKITRSIYRIFLFLGIVILTSLTVFLMLSLPIRFFHFKQSISNGVLLISIGIFLIDIICLGLWEKAVYTSNNIIKFLKDLGIKPKWVKYQLLITLYSLFLCMMGLVGSGLYYFFSINMSQEVTLGYLEAGFISFIVNTLILTIIIYYVVYYFIATWIVKKTNSSVAQQAGKYGNIAPFKNFFKVPPLWLMVLLPIVTTPIFFLISWYGIHVHPFGKSNIIKIAAALNAGAVGMLVLLPLIINYSFKKDKALLESSSETGNKSDENNKGNHTP